MKVEEFKQAVRQWKRENDLDDEDIVAALFDALEEMDNEEVLRLYELMAEVLDA